MEITVYNPPIGRLDTVAVEFTKDNDGQFSIVIPDGKCRSHFPV